MNNIYIPNDILKDIFNFIDNNEDYDSIRVLSQFWYNNNKCYRKFYKKHNI